VYPNAKIEAAIDLVNKLNSEKLKHYVSNINMAISAQDVPGDRIGSGEKEKIPAFSLKFPSEIPTPVP
jgi:hypothetical protein